MRRLNRGLFQLALENEVPAQTETEEGRRAAAPTEAAPAEVAPVEEAAPAAAAEVVVEVKTDGEAQVEQTGGEAAAAPAAEVPAEGEGARAEAAVATEDEETARAAAAAEVEAAAEVPAEPAAEVPAEPAAEPAVEVPSEPAAAEAPAEAAPAAAEGETVEVKNDNGETVAEVTTGEGTTVVSTDAPAEITVTETAEGVDVRVQVDATAEGAREAAREPVAAEAPAEEPAIAAEDLVEIVADGETAEVEISDAVDVAEDTAELVAEVDEAEEAAVALEALAEVAEIAAQQGGLDANGARLLKISTEHIYSHMGLGKAMGIPAMESFEIPGARASATTIALEDIKEQAKKVWEAIINGIKQAAAWLQEFVGKLISANARTKARAEKLLEATKSMDGAPKEKTISDAKLFASVVVVGRQPSNVAAEVKKVVDFFGSVVNSRTAQALAGVEQAILEAVSTKKADQVEDKVREAIVAVVGKGLQHKVSGKLASDAGIGAAPAGTSISMTPSFLGNQVVWAYMPESVEAISSFRSGIGTYAVNAGEGKLNVLAPAQIAAVAKEALAYVEAAEGYKAVQDQVKKLSNSLAVQLARGAQGLAEGGAAAQAKSILNAIKAARHLAKGIHQPAGVVAARAVNAALNLAVASARQYGAKVEAPAAAAAAA